MREMADVLYQFGTVLSAPHAKRWKGEEQALLDVLKAETFLTAAECLEHGLCDEVVDEIQAEARFDADALHDDIHCYRLDGSYIGPAECLHAVGFADTAAAREHARKTKALFRAHRDLAELERGMTLRQAAALLPRIERAQREPEPAPKLVRPLFGTVGSAALKPRIEELEDDLPAHTRDVVTAIDAFFPRPRRPADD
jgi:enoyl-CoA hydratase/carnithine racemase